MYSQCPECKTRFRVTAEALRAAHGTVRCGRCGSAFDALARLSDAVPPPHDPTVERAVADSGETGATLPASAATAEYHFTADDLEKVFIDARDWQKQFGVEALLGGSTVPAEAPAPAATETPSEPVAEAQAVVVDENEAVEDITLEGERISIEVPPDWPSDDGEERDLDATDEYEVLGEVPDSAYPQEDHTDETPGLLMAGSDDREPPLESRAAIEPSPGPIPETVPEPPREPSPSSSTLAAQRWRRPAEAEESAAVEEAPAHSSWRTAAWSLGCLLLALVLLAQTAHYYRQDLVRHPQLGPLLRNVYDRIGLPLSPNWDLAAFELRQWGNGAPDTDGRMSIRASLTNRASFAQPHPVLRLELNDRFGESIAVRDFEPPEYLKNPAEASRLLEAGASTEADLEIADPGQEAVGYQLDVCLRESPTLLRCAQGPG